MEVVFLHGPAAAGKLTTARALECITGFAVFHNHLVVDALLALFPFGSPEFVRLRDLYWMAAFQAAADAGRSFVFTFTPEPTVPLDFPARASASITERGGRIVFVALEVSLDEQEARIRNADRLERGKLSDVATLRRLRESETGPRPTAPRDLVINTDASPARTTAALIQQRLGLHPVRRHVRYGSVGLHDQRRGLEGGRAEGRAKPGPGGTTRTP